MSRKQFRHKFLPYRLLLTILYGNFTWLTWESPYTFKLQTGPMGRRLRVPNSRIREYIEYLQRHRFLTGVEFGTGWARGTVRPPNPWVKYLP